MHHILEAITLLLLLSAPPALAAGPVVPAGLVCDGSNQGAVIESAIAHGARWVILPSGCRWNMEGAYIVPAGTRITGEDASVVIDGTRTTSVIPGTNGLGPGFPWVGPGVTLERMTVRDANGAGFIGSFTNITAQARPYSTVAQDVGADMTKDGAPGTANSVGVAVSHVGPGSGDNFYAQATVEATEFRDALYRGDMMAGSQPFNGVGPASVFGGFMFPTAHRTALGLMLRDMREQGVTAWLSQTAARRDSVLLGLEHSGADCGDTCNGLYITVGNNGGNWRGNVLNVTNGGPQIFFVNGDGLTWTRAGFQVNDQVGASRTIAVRRADGSVCTLSYTGGILDERTTCR